MRDFGILDAEPPLCARGCRVEIPVVQPRNSWFVGYSVTLP